jgi:hypothetical protein
MSVVWTAVIAALSFVEKLLAIGVHASRILAVVFVALGMWVATAPGSVPGLHRPAAGGPAMKMSS